MSIDLSTMGKCRLKIIRNSSLGIQVKHADARAVLGETTGRNFAVQ
jgi:hypothetical protein